MTYLLIAVCVIAVLAAYAQHVSNTARRKAAGVVAAQIMGEINTYMTLSGFVQKVPNAPVWGRVLGTHQMVCEVAACGRTGKVTVHCTQVPQKGAERKAGRGCKLTLEGSAFKVTDTLAMQEQARKFVADCAKEYLPPASDRVLNPLLGFLDRITGAKPVRK